MLQNYLIRKGLSKDLQKYIFPSSSFLYFFFFFFDVPWEKEFICSNHNVYNIQHYFHLTYAFSKTILGVQTSLVCNPMCVCPPYKAGSQDKR